ncbi:glycosyltransferase family 39 protein [Heyndrickxia acidicola]|uniref:Glycosyltransferase family 39 protein n=1 Tax=Heyndrickxia acidicola TaxID=209389 RepID=A0ABU6MNV7_9BACI|nr:glycosyltransferase family 39 protein [Heyndrickxia acidicola]MED1205318.1 glycosyltransferase family 39 protein [Heyndrickxia acidicola]
MIKHKWTWHSAALGMILLLSVMLNFYKLAEEGYGNLYYSSAVKSMLGSWHNFFFNSFDSKGFISIDKPPAGFWIQAVSAHIFGFNGWSLFFPQALAGVLSTAVLYHLVARVFGKGTGLLAALFLTVTPIVVASDRTNEVDSLLMLVILAAAWATMKAAEVGRLRWLLGAAALIGIGFNIKMMEAFLILPAFLFLYYYGSKMNLKQKCVHMVCAAAVLAVVSMSWAIVVDMTPADQRPYVGSTTDNSMVDLAVGYNGINRLFSKKLRHLGNIQVMAADKKDQTSQPNLYQHSNETGNSINAAFTPIGSEIGRPGFLRLFRTPHLNGQLSWFLPSILFSVLSLFWGNGRREFFGRKRLSVLFWCSWVMVMFLIFSMANEFSSYYMVILAPGIAALAAIGWKNMWIQWQKGGVRSWILPLSLLCTAAYDLSVIWSYHTFRWLSFIVGAFLLVAITGLVLNWKTARRSFSILAFTGIVAVTLTAPAAWAMTPILYGGDSAYPYAGPELEFSRAHDFLPSNGKLEHFLKTKYQGRGYLVGTANARAGAPIYIDTGLPVMSMGGFIGTDPALTITKLENLSQKGEIHYFLAPSSPIEGQNSAVYSWLNKHCHVVPPRDWQEPATSKDYKNWNLYEYKAK